MTVERNDFGEEELVFQLLEEERKVRMKRIAKEKKITTEDCLVLGILRLNGEIGGLYKGMDDINERIDTTNERMDKMNEKIEDTKISLNERIDTTNERMDKMNEKIEDTKTSLNERIDSNFKWIIALIIGTWATTLAILIPMLLNISGL
jgi:tetrahydromethanopterin S-methyltransferase subunit G